MTVTAAAPRATKKEVRTFARTLLGAVRAKQLYPDDNAVVVRAMVDVAEAAAPLCSDEPLVLTLSGDFLKVSACDWPLDATSQREAAALKDVLRAHGVHTLTVAPDVTPEHWRFFAGCLTGSPDDMVSAAMLRDRLEEAGVETIDVAGEDEPDADTASAEGDGEGGGLAAARRTYQRSVSVAHEVLTEARLGRAVNVRKVKQAVQGIVDQVLSDEQSIMAMTVLRDYDEYTFTHCVNVSIISGLIGHAVGLDREQLHDLTLGALLHDLGKTRIDPEIVNKPGALTDEEFRIMQDHPAEGLLQFFRLQGFAERSYRQMLMAYEHHLKTDLTGYPEVSRPRNPELFSHIVTVADAFDALTSNRCYREALRPDEVLQKMRDDHVAWDPVLVKALINVTGVYPAGSVVRLDTGEIGVVLRRNPDPRLLDRPIVKIVVEASGARPHEPPVVDLADFDPGGVRRRRSVLGTLEPEPLGIDVAEHVA